VANPAWSPHGHRIAYFAVQGGQRDIWTVRPDGSDPRRVTEDAPTDWWPRWALGGRYLYFLSDRGGADNIWRVPVDETSGRTRGAPEPVTSGTSAVAAFEVTPDGRRIALTELAFEGRLEPSNSIPPRRPSEAPPAPSCRRWPPCPTSRRTGSGSPS
jgi:Tol biopolymer transport system component